MDIRNVGFGRIRALGLLCVVVWLAAGCSDPVSNRTAVVAQAARQSSIARAPGVNVVLVHGAWADGTSWDRVIQLLERKGYEVTSVQIPLTSLEADVARTRHVLSMLDGPAILVGHSYGGAVITGAGDAPNVAGLVYVAAFAPDAGEPLGALNEKFAPPPGLQAVRGPDPQGFLWLDRAGFHDAFAQDVSERVAGVMGAVQKPLAAQVFATPLTSAAWHDRPTWFMVAEEDRMISPELERFEAARMKAHVTSVRSSHALMVSRPADVARVIEQAADQVSGWTLGG